MTHRQQTYTEGEAISLLREHLRQRGAQKRLAEEFGVSTAYVNQWVKGTTSAKRLSPKFLRAIGLRRVTYIERISPDAI